MSGSAGGWQAKLVRRLSIEIPGVRSALYPADLLAALRDLRGFRHVVTHSYDLDLDLDRLAIVVRHGVEIAGPFATLWRPSWAESSRSSAPDFTVATR